MKKILIWLFLTTMLFVSCSDDNYLPNDNASSGDNLDNVEKPNQDPESDLDLGEEMRQAVKSYVSETCQYKNFCFYITIRTDLSEEYPDKFFEYGIEMGYGSYDYYVYATGYGNVYSIEQPVFIYAEGSPYAVLMFSWRSYQSLLADMENGPLTSSEQSFYNDIVKLFKNSESAAKSSFIYRVFVDVDGNRYYL